MAKRTAKEIERLINQLETLNRINKMQIIALKKELIDIELAEVKMGSTPNFKIPWPEEIFI